MYSPVRQSPQEAVIVPGSDLLGEHQCKISEAEQTIVWCKFARKIAHRLLCKLSCDQSKGDTYRRTTPTSRYHEHCLRSTGVSGTCWYLETNGTL